MPVYVYQCDSCGYRFERLQRVDDPPAKRCPKCRNSVRKVFFPVGIIFKGSGFHATDYGRGNNGRPRSKLPDLDKATKDLPDLPTESKTKKED